MWKLTKNKWEPKELPTSRDYDGRELPHRFRLVDGDGIVYYEGLSDDSESEEAFAPLDDYGEGAGGCADIEYLRNGKWQAL